MGYYTTAAFTSPFAGTPKKHTPLSRLQKRGQRYYSPGLGRWLSRDPIGEEGGANIYEFVENDPVSLIDALGLEWSDPERKGGRGAQVKCEACDKVSDLAKKIALDATEFRKWLAPVGSASMPQSENDPIPQASTYTVPNVAYITYGNMITTFYGQREIAGDDTLRQGFIANMNEAESYYRGEGYLVYHFTPPAGFGGHSLSLVSSVLGTKDIAIWIHAGHGNSRGLVIGAGKTTVPPSTFGAARHHRLSRIVLYACDQGQLADAWLDSIAPGGDLRAWPQFLKVGRMTGLPYAWLRKYPKPLPK